MGFDRINVVRTAYNTVYVAYMHNMITSYKKKKCPNRVELKKKIFRFHKRF